MSSFSRFADAWLPTVVDVSLVASAICLVHGLWKIVRFVGLCRLFKRCLAGANARLGIISPLGVVTDRERRAIEHSTSATDRAGQPMIF